MNINDVDEIDISDTINIDSDHKLGCFSDRKANSIRSHIKKKF